MICINVDIKELIPIQGLTTPNSLEWWLQQPTPDQKSIPVVAYNGRYLTCDGHHGTLARLIKGLNERPIKIMEYDDEIPASGEGAFCWSDSIPQLVKRYEKNWKLDLQARGIYSFNDYFKVYAEQIAEINSRLRIK